MLRALSLIKDSEESRDASILVAFSFNFFPPLSHFRLTACVLLVLIGEDYWFHIRFLEMIAFYTLLVKC